MPRPGYRDPAVPSFGLNGFEYVSDTVARTGDYCAFHCIADTVFSAFTSSPTRNATSNTFTSQTFPAGTVIYAQISAFTLASGRGIAYNA
jgi:hypothetical protein